MKLPITHYEITTRDIIEIIFGTLLVIFSLLGSIIIANLVLLPIIKNSKNNHLNIFILCIHIIIIVLFIMLIRYIATQYIKNHLIRESIYSFFGPLIAGSSLFFIYNVKEIVTSTINIVTKN